MDSLHQYIMAQHHVADYNAYIRLLAMYRNTAAIEAANARARHDDLRQAIRQILVIREAIIEKYGSLGPSP